MTGDQAPGRPARKGWAFGSRVLGPTDEPGPKVSARVQLLLTTTVVVANVVGAAVVTAIATGLTGGLGILRSAGALTLNAVAVPSYVAMAVAVGTFWGTRRVRPRLRWVRDESAPTADDQRAALRVPLELMKVQLVLWGLATVVFTSLNATVAPRLALQVGFTVALGGAVVSANVYLLSEFAMRPIAARALSTHVPDRLQVPGVTARALLAWGLGTLPVIGLMELAISSLVQHGVSKTQLAGSILGLGATTLVFGLLLAALAARATVDPIKGLRLALARVGDGNLEVEVAVYDGTEVGLLQAGFNHAVSGLRERERIRDLFGRHVGEDVARAALARGDELGGEVLDVAVLFVDVIGSTTLAATRPPEQVVAILNRFFAVVVEVVAEHGGFVNKFEGDAALAIFGAPEPIVDAAGSALAAGRVLAGRLAADVTDCTAGIGVAAGSVVAGNIGNERRYEYTVIGDPVNEAARLTDLAKDVPGRLLASMRAVAAAEASEAARWEAGEELLLRGRTEPTRLATPRGSS